MHLKPLIIVKGSRELSFAEAHKFIKKFHTTCSEKAASSLQLNHGKHEPTVSEDILDKLALLVEETKRQAELHPETSVNTVAKSHSKKRESLDGSSSKEEQKKKRKRETKEEESIETLKFNAPATPSIESSEKKKKKSKKSEK